MIHYHDPALFLRMLVAAIVFPLTVPEIAPSNDHEDIAQRVIREVSNIYLQLPQNQ
ncbi:hypothetical protein KHX94_08395 [Shewanella dokdonensis]|uniref:TetR family transcriptional regulator n=1 Tax=Shewanella dokdonensis TaxID=712036 RepID=A0ABX8DI58_9GAMM|nr:hypothetical protein [Shewanella dokdonensis]QVK24468.1 hypothetical protein KHX94_08395 [Shewanella dokdonensis]